MPDLVTIMYFFAQMHIDGEVEYFFELIHLLCSDFLSKFIQEIVYGQADLSKF